MRFTRREMIAGVLGAGTLIAGGARASHLRRPRIEISGTLLHRRTEGPDDILLVTDDGTEWIVTLRDRRPETLAPGTRLSVPGRRIAGPFPDRMTAEALTIEDSTG